MMDTPLIEYCIDTVPADKRIDTAAEYIVSQIFDGADSHDVLKAAGEYGKDPEILGEVIKRFGERLKEVCNQGLED